MSSGGDQEVQAALSKALALVKAKDDTSRFVGLSLMRKLLDEHEALRQDPSTVARCRDAIPARFLRRLLRSRSSEKRSEDEAKGMRHLAIAIIHSFITLLAKDGSANEKTIILCDPLIEDLNIVDVEYQELIWQILYSLADDSEAVKIMISTEGIHRLYRTLDHDKTNAERLGRLLSLSWLAATKTSITNGVSLWDRAIMQLIKDESKPNPTFVLQTVAIALEPTVLTSQPIWLSSLSAMCQRCISSRPTTQIRRAVITIYAILIRNSQPSLQIAGRLFSAWKGRDEPETPFAYIFINLLLIDIRTTIPSLMERLASPDYTSTSLRLAECYDILTAFISWLLQTVANADEDIVEGRPGPGLPMSADHLLKIRKDCKETFSLTLEFLRDRWDAAITGAKGLDPATYDIVRPPEVSSQPLALTWDNPTISPMDDPIVLAGLRSVALWTREDEDTELQEQVLGIFDMLLALIKSSAALDAKDNTRAAVDFRSTNLILLNTLLATHEAAVQQFLELDAWPVVSSVGLSALQDGLPFARDALQCLISVVESPLVPQSRQSWMSLVTQVSRVSIADITGNAVEDLAAAYQLCALLLQKAAVRVRDMYKEERRSLESRTQKLALQTEDEDLRFEIMGVLSALNDMA